MHDSLSGTADDQPTIGAAHLSQLRAAARGGPVLILTHDNPDPDALASGKALATLLQAAWNLPARLVYSGLVARAENRAMLGRLTPEWEHHDQPGDLKQYSAVALVDTQPGAGNNRLPANLAPDIVIDHHHPIRQKIQAVRYADVRPEMGATATMLYQYLELARIEPDPILATALFYGLKTDTRGLSRGAAPADEAVYIKLLARLDRRELIRVEQAGLPLEYFRALIGAFQNARLHGQAVVARLGMVHRPDLSAELADLLIRLEGVRAVLCSGVYEGTVHISLRTVPLGQDAGLLIQQLITAPGTAGGHGTMAGGQIPLHAQPADQALVDLETRFLAVMGESHEGVSLL